MRLFVKRSRHTLEDARNIALPREPKVCKFDDSVRGDENILVLYAKVGDADLLYVMHEEQQQLFDVRGVVIRQAGVDDRA